ncbi:hypothetical protein JTB14_023305 [Gonioctena quinquepunctata]|nr:hypothetical protein JTB14_023305 [Gonioctena quinquepunctata]
MSKVTYIYIGLLVALLAYSLKLVLEKPKIIYFENGNPILQILNGKIRGHLLTTENNREYYAFQEIPYAAPPIGDLRFKAPIPANDWDGILETTKNTKVCYQKKPPVDDQTPDPRENEDCLYLNVFTTKLPTDGGADPLPILVYIYGGMFQSGEPTEYNFDSYLEQDIVLVTFNYRSGALGWLTTEDGVIEGNQALRDQNLVLRWIQKNIQFFGGDPKKVTIAGHSSGAACVGYHILSPKSTGLFRAGILQSSSAINTGALVVDQRYNAFALGRALSPNLSLKNSSDDLLKLLKTLPAAEIMRTNIDLPLHLWNTYDFSYPINSSVSIENPDDENAFLTGPFHDNLMDGKMNRVPILIGITDEEFLNQHLTTENAASWDNNITSIIINNERIKTENRVAYAKELIDIYTKVPFQKNLTAFYKLIADCIFSSPTIRHADLHSKYADTYFYQFSYKGPLNGLNRKLNRPPGLGKNGHCAELAFLYKYRWEPNVIPSPSDNLTRKRFARLWGNFIKYSNPTPSPDPLLQNVIWPKVTPNSFNFLDIDSKLSLKKDPRSYKEWKLRLDKYLEHPLATY